MSRNLDLLIKVSRASINEKVFGVTEQKVRETITNAQELEEALRLLPTEEEKEFMRILQSSAPELERVRRRMSVCVLAEVKELEHSKVVYEYNGKLFSIEAPENSFEISKTLREKGEHEAVQAFCKQGKIKIDGVIADLETLAVDEINLLVTITSRFFFQIYLT